jgi:hypothetical protein
MAKHSRRKPNPNAAIHHHEGGDWEPVWQGNSEAEAEIVAGGLQADGIPARSLGSQQVPVALPYAFLADTWAVFVPSSRAERSRDILRRRGSAADIVEGSSDFSGDQRATLKFAAIGLLAMAVFALYQVLRSAL